MSQAPMYNWLAVCHMKKGMLPCTLIPSDTTQCPAHVTMSM
jgi:hypothetical protein